MDTLLKWKKGVFSCNYKLLSDGKKIGNLKSNSLSRKTEGRLNGKNFEFRTRGFLKPRVQIFDLEKRKVVGNISFNCWSPEAKIELDGEVSHWGFTNIWKSKWNVFSEGKEPIFYQGGTCNGKIKADEVREAKVLAGLYVSNYFREIAAVYVGVFFPSLLIFL